MVLIVTDGIDATTHDVIDWLIKKNVKYLILDSQSSFKSFYIDISNNKFILSFNGAEQLLDLSIINSVWYRKGDITIDLFNFLPNVNNDLKKNIFEHLKDEWNTIKYFFFENLENKKQLGNYFTKIKSKLGYLKCAVNCGIIIPNTFILNSKSQLFVVKENQTEIITKSIQDIFNIVSNDKSLFTYTSLVSNEQMTKMSDNFFPSLVQKKIEKKYELRIFLLAIYFFPMAIFSQNDEKTKIDFRNYNNQKPNRTVPYKMPFEIEQKIHTFITSSQLNTGSIDMIVTPNNEYIFLEVNQAGQFGGVSSDCNYYLEKEVAEYLS